MANPAKGRRVVAAAAVGVLSAVAVCAAVGAISALTITLVVPWNLIDRTVLEDLFLVAASGAGVVAGCVFLLGRRRTVNRPGASR
ncbi:MAG: hypothetical protein QOJ66_1590 [Ilumatobacteraceae bacterium]|jgi:hypothetical protein